MFGPGGIAYVYLSYGMHRCINVVTGSQGRGEAVLLRAALPLFNLSAMAQRRGRTFEDSPKVQSALASGPGKLTEAMGITLADNGRRWDERDFKIVDLGYRVKPGQISRSPRIGITKGVELPWRFFITGTKAGWIAT